MAHHPLAGWWPDRSAADSFGSLERRGVHGQADELDEGVHRLPVLLAIVEKQFLALLDEVAGHHEAVQPAAAAQQ
mgnify:CR=1 FL=1